MLEWSSHVLPWASGNTESWWFAIATAFSFSATSREVTGDTCVGLFIVDFRRRASWDDWAFIIPQGVARFTLRALTTRGSVASFRGTVSHRVTTITFVIRFRVVLILCASGFDDADSIDHNVAIQTLSASGDIDSYSIQRDGGNDVVFNGTVIDLSDDNTIASFNQVLGKVGRASLSKEGITVAINDSVGVSRVEDGDSGSIVHDGEVNLGCCSGGANWDIDEGLEISKVEISKTIVESGSRSNAQTVSILTPWIG